MSEIAVELKTKKYNAQGVFVDGKLIVKKGSVISKYFKTNYAYNKVAKKYRDSSEYVNKDFVVKKDIEFTSPSTAAQFVLGYSSNGWKAWKVGKREYLEMYKGDIV